MSLIAFILLWNFAIVEAFFHLQVKLVKTIVEALERM
jgi:hypothetical protein